MSVGGNNNLNGIFANETWKKRSVQLREWEEIQALLRR
jgi:hypothetical protein